MENTRSCSPLLQLLAQGVRFGIVGLLATGVHIMVCIGCIEILGIAPLWANFPAFLVALIASFIGHFSWTFRMQHRELGGCWRPVLLKFALVSCFGLGLNTLAVYLIVNLLGYPYMYAVVLMVTVVPAAIFLLQKFWAFN